MTQTAFQITFFRFLKEKYEKLLKYNSLSTQFVQRTDKAVLKCMKLNAKSIPHFVQCSVLFCTSAQDKIRNCNKGFQSLMHCQTCLVLYVLQWRNGQYPKLDFWVSTRNNLSKNGLKVDFQSSVMLHLAHSLLSTVMKYVKKIITKSLDQHISSRSYGYSRNPGFGYP